MKIIVILSFFYFCLSNAEEIIRPKQAISKIKYYTYSQDIIYKIKTAPGLITDISFSQDEEVFYYNLGFKTAWKVQQPSNSSMIVISPKANQPETNLIVKTKDAQNTYRTYLFTLTSLKEEWKNPDDAEYNFAIRFKYPNKKKVKKNKKQKVVKKILAPKFSKNINNYKINTGYEFNDYSYRETLGADFLVPWAVYDNSLVTFITFKNGSPRPSIYSYESETEKLINYTVGKDGKIIIHGVFSNLLLRIDKNIVELRRNNTFKSDNTLKTTTGHKRVLRGKK